jgi:hypothetical protein
MLDYLTRRFQIRLALAAVLIPIVLFALGVGELYRCIRVVIGPHTMTFAEATSERLGRYTYIRVTGIAADLQRSEVLMRGKRPESGETSNWECAYIPMVSDDGTPPPGRGRIVAFLPHARDRKDLLALEDADELTGFVKCSFDRVNPGHRTLIRTLGGADPASCWIVDAERPSWLKALGLTGASAVIPLAAVIWCMKAPLERS